LQGCPDELIQRPWENPLLLSQSKYPRRIVLHEIQRDKCLAMFKAVKK
jgi:deoxyribodipyrimidine photolyase